MRLRGIRIEICPDRTGVCGKFDGVATFAAGKTGTPLEVI